MNSAVAACCCRTDDPCSASFWAIGQGRIKTQSVIPGFIQGDTEYRVQWRVLADRNLPVLDTQFLASFEVATTVRDLYGGGVSYSLAYGVGLNGTRVDDTCQLYLIGGCPGDGPTDNATYGNRILSPRLPYRPSGPTVLASVYDQPVAGNYTGHYITADWTGDFGPDPEPQNLSEFLGWLLPPIGTPLAQFQEGMYYSMPLPVLNGVTRGSCSTIPFDAPTNQGASVLVPVLPDVSGSDTFANSTDVSRTPFRIWIEDNGAGDPVSIGRFTAFPDVALFCPGTFPQESIGYHCDRGTIGQMPPYFEVLEYESEATIS